MRRPAIQVIEVNMRIEIGAMDIFMRAPAIERGVANQPVDPGDRGHGAQKVLAEQMVIQLPVEWADIGHFRVHRLAPRAAQFVDGQRGIKAGKSRSACSARSGIRKLSMHRWRKGRAAESVGAGHRGRQGRQG
jgi:hypothetical protein